MTIRQQIAKDLNINGPFTTHDTKDLAIAKAIKSGGSVQKWQGTYISQLSGLSFAMTIWVCVK